MSNEKETSRAGYATPKCNKRLVKIDEIRQSGKSCGARTNAQIPSTPKNDIRNHQSMHKYRVKTESVEEDEDAYNRATELITRMNERRRIKS